MQVKAAELLGMSFRSFRYYVEEVQPEMMRLPARGDRPMAFALLALSLVYLWLFVPRGWIPHDEGMLGQSAERVLAGGLPHIDYEEPYTGGLTWMHAAVFKLAGIDLLYLRWLLFAGAVAAQMLTYLILRRYLEPVAAAVGAWVALGWSFPNYFAALPSWWLLVCALACTWSFARHVDTGRPIDAAAAGLAAGVSILIKQTGLYVLMALVMALVYVPGAERESHQPSRRAQVPAVAVAVAGIVLAFWILRARLSNSDLLYLLLPIAACCRLLFSNRGRGAQTGSHALLRGLVPALGGAAVPLVCFVAPYVLDGQVATLINGAFVLPQRRVQFASVEMPPAHWIFAGLPLLWAVAPVPSLARWPLRGWWPSAIVLSLAAVALAVRGLYSPAVYQLIWQAARGAAALLPVAICVVLARPRGQDAKERRILFGIAAMLAWASLVQFPFSAPIYFCYVTPLAVLAAVALAGNAGVATRPALPGAALLLLVFALASMNRGYVHNLGVVHEVMAPTVPLELERASLRVSGADAVMYQRLLRLIASRIGDGQLVAGPDAPEVYFLAGRFSPSGTLFDFFDDHGSLEGGTNDLPGWQTARVVVLNLSRRFSLGPSTDVAASIEQAFPHSRVVGTFEVRWR